MSHSDFLKNTSRRILAGYHVNIIVARATELFKQMNEKQLFNLLSYMYNGVTMIPSVIQWCHNDSYIYTMISQ